MVTLPLTFIWQNEAHALSKPLEGNRLHQLAAETLNTVGMGCTLLSWGQKWNERTEVFFALNIGDWLFTPFDNDRPWSLAHKGRKLQWKAFASQNQHRASLPTAKVKFKELYDRMWVMGIVDFSS